MSLFDRFISWVSPRWAVERRAWREAEREQREYFAADAYRQAKRTRLNSAGVGDSYPDLALESGDRRRNMMKRARELDRDSGIVSGALDRSTENVIGCGIRPQARTESDSWNRLAEELFERDAAQADVRGLSSFADLQRHVFRSTVRDGDCGTIMLGDGRLQIVESDLIAAPFSRRGIVSSRHVDGIDMDRFGKPTAYHVIQIRDREDDGEVFHLTDPVNYPERTKIPAKNMLFTARRESNNQTRGASVLANSFILIEQIEGLREAVVVAARMAACFGLVITSPFPASPNMPNAKGSDGYNRPSWRLEPGMFKRLSPGEEIKPIQGMQPPSNHTDFMVSLYRQLGIPLGLPLEVLLMDFSRTNYSSARSSMIQAQQAFRCLQKLMVDHWCRPIWNRWVNRWIEDGEISARPDAFRHDWIPPGWKWVDPLKEAQAYHLRMDAGIDTLADIVESEGRDWEQVLEQRAKEIARMDELGIPRLHSRFVQAENQGDPEFDVPPEDRQQDDKPTHLEPATAAA